MTLKSKQFSAISLEPAPEHHLQSTYSLPGLRLRVYSHITQSLLTSTAFSRLRGSYHGEEGVPSPGVLSAAASVLSAVTRAPVTSTRVCLKRRLFGVWRIRKDAATVHGQS